MPGGGLSRWAIVAASSVVFWGEAIMLTPAPGVVVGDRYVLSRPLAQGGMGSVWIARHRDLDVDVTVKFMMPTLVNSADLRARFEREAKVAARLRSQHVVQVLDFGIDDEMPYIAMELLEGENLADRLKRETRLSLQTSGHIIAQVCKALRTAHDAGLVHRDLKPGNIFLAVKDGEEVVKVLDFGIVKDTAKNDADEASGGTETGVMMGSVHYMSPEQIRSSRQVDHRSDLWSVAVILYKMLTGNPPFPGTNHGDVMVRVCTDSCPPPSSVLPGLSASIDAFFVRALTRDPAARFQSAQEMADAFAAAVAAAAAAFSSGPPQQWAKTLPLFGQNAELMAARAAASAARQTLASSSDVSSSAVRLESAPGTFQAVSMAPAQTPPLTGSAIASPSVQRGPSQKLIAAIAAGAVLGIGLLFVFFFMGGASQPEESTLAASNSASLVNGHASAPAPKPTMNVDLAPPVSSELAAAMSSAPSSSSSPVMTSPAKPTSTAPTKSTQQTRKNPLDIND